MSTYFPKDKGDYPRIKTVKSVDVEGSPELHFDYERAGRDLSNGTGVIREALANILRNQKNLDLRLRKLESREG